MRVICTNIHNYRWLEFNYGVRVGMFVCFNLICCGLFANILYETKNDDNKTAMATNKFTKKRIYI